MTLYDERTTADEVSVVVDRRAPTRGVRLSWASPHPVHWPKAEAEEVAPLASAGPDLAASALQRRSARVRSIRHRVLLGDLLLACVVTLGVGWSFRPSPLALPAIVLVSALAWGLVLTGARAYDSRLLGDGPEEFQAILRAAVCATATLGILASVLQDAIPRRFLLLGIPALAVVTALNHYGVRQWLHHQRGRGRQMRRTLVVGDGTAASSTIGDLQSSPHLGLQVVGTCQQLSGGPGPRGVPVLGSLADIPQVVVDSEVDVVLVASGGLTGPALRRLSWALERVGADLVVAPGLIEVAGPRVSVRPAAGLSLLHVEAPRPSLGRVVGKAVFDRTMGLLMFLCAVPVLAASYLAVRLTSAGPGFFAQHRVGLDGSTFVMWKLRSMVVDAERVREELLESSDGNEVMFKMRHDPRVTPVGRWLRRFSLDELPQLWNVVRGDMSLVGPRPSLPDEYAQYRDAVHRRLRVKPGLTGLWQVSGRADLSWEEAVRLDLRYVDNWSLALDVQILWKTVRAVFAGSGAY